MNPPGVRPAGQGFRDRVRAAGGSLQPDEPVDPAQRGPVEHAENPEPGRFREPAVTPGGGLIGDARHVGDGAERRSWFDSQYVGYLPVNGVQHRDFHTNQPSESRDPAQSALAVDNYFRLTQHGEPKGPTPGDGADTREGTDG